MPAELPEGSMLILNDRIPVCGHDPEAIVQQMEQIISTCKPSCVLLDLQREGNSLTATVAKRLADSLPCPVGITPHYGKDLAHPVFLPPPPLNCTLEEYLLPWAQREIWLEAALTNAVITVTEDGSQYKEISDAPNPRFADKELHCHYRADISEDAVRIYLQRTPDDLSALLRKAESLGVTRAAGLYQELGDFSPFR